jgi:glycosyltransferase involved in cell wall biosynthesis
MPATWARMNLESYDSILVSSHLFAHHIGGRMRGSARVKHVYVHTPARYIWTPELDPRGDNRLARMVSHPLKALDVKRASQGSVFAANSEYVRERIADAWHQDARVIYPPTDVERLHAVDNWREELSDDDMRIYSSLPDEFLLGASRFVPYKRLDLVIKAGEASGIPVVLAGSGPQLSEVTAAAARATVPVHVVVRPSDALLYALYQRAIAFVFPAVEDFGIMPVEAMSLGTPAIVGPVGGAKESVNILNGGVIVDFSSASELRIAVENAASLNMSDARERARANFSSSSFKQRIVDWVTTKDGH